MGQRPSSHMRAAPTTSKLPESLARPSLCAAPGSERLGASGGVWTATGERVDDDGVKVIEAIHTNGYPSEFPWWEWQTMPPNH